MKDIETLQQKIDDIYDNISSVSYMDFDLDSDEVMLEGCFNSDDLRTIADYIDTSKR